MCHRHDSQQPSSTSLYSLLLPRNPNKYPFHAHFSSVRRAVSDKIGLNTLVWCDSCLFGTLTLDLSPSIPLTPMPAGNITQKHTLLITSIPPERFVWFSSAFRQYGLEVSVLCIVLFSWENLGKSRKLQLRELARSSRIPTGTDYWKPVGEAKIGKERAGIEIWKLSSEVDTQSQKKGPHFLCEQGCRSIFH